ncbi:DnaJ domain-containing protein [Haloparvum sp. PAK95]|uniref:DnaJ domain-containing protein n=1 Tax=Haloparvum sp. PAK95 TaxID=3418962 RepID=UPI003D2F4464
MPADFYDLLEVDEDASEDEIKRAYRDKATRYHPDVNDDPRATDQFATLNKARDVLTSSKERARYDRLGHRDYVAQHLDGLPTMTRPGQNEEADSSDENGSGADETTGTGSGSDSDGDSPEYGRGTGGTGTATNRTRSGATGSASGTSSPGSGAGASSGSSAGASSNSSTSTSTNTSSNRSSSTRSTSASGSTSGSASSRASRTGTGSGSTASTGSTGAGRASTSTRTGTRQSTGRTTSPSPSPRRVGLRRGWIAAIVALLCYLAGLGAFATVASDGASAAIAALQANPVGALTAPSPLADPVAITLAAIEAATAGKVIPALLVPVGLVALPLTVTVSVVRFGQGTAYLYGAGVVVPLVWVGARTAVAAPLAADLVALVVVPLLAALWFLVDVGRYLRG